MASLGDSDANPLSPSRGRKRRKVEREVKEILAHPTYTDYASRSEDDLRRELDRSPAIDHFPATLHKAIENAEIYGYSNIITWRPHGRSFYIQNKDDFTKSIIPVFFPSQGQYASFHRQINSYGFLRLTRHGPDQDSFYHPLFLRGRPELSCYISRSRHTKNKVRRIIDSSTEPDFSLYPPLPPLAISYDRNHKAQLFHVSDQKLFSSPHSQTIQHGPSLSTAGTCPNDNLIETTSFHASAKNGNETHLALSKQPTDLPSSWGASVGLKSSATASSDRISSEIMAPSIDMLNMNLACQLKAVKYRDEDEDEDEDEDDSSVMSSVVTLSTTYNDVAEFLEDVDLSGSFEIGTCDSSEQLA